MKGKTNDLTCSGCGEYVGSHIGQRIRKLEAALEQIIEFRAARTYFGAVVAIDEQYPDVRIAMEALND